MKRFFSPQSLLLSLAALIGIALCLVAAQWQWHRGEVRSHQNSIINANQKRPPLSSAELSTVNPVADQWRTVDVRGSFDAEHQLLLRDRYYQGQYGFEVLNLFHIVNGRNIWIDRGWVKAGSSASTPPVVAPPSSTPVQVSVRIRSDDVSRQVQGSFFAIPRPGEKTIDLAHAQGMEAFGYYGDLLASSGEKTDLLAPMTLPELTNGPHFAYALQWLLFALLFLAGRILLFRESK